jgi:hypothetical protein
MTPLRKCVVLIACVTSISSLCASQSKAPAAGRAYSEVPFNPAVERLPANYQGNDAERIYQLIQRRQGSRTKGEFETSGQYGARIEHQDGQPLAGLLHMTSLFAFKAAELKSRYDADSGMMKLYVPTSYAVDDAGQVDSSKVAVTLHENSSFRSYPASNAFGATTLVKEKDVKSIEIGVLDAPDFDLRNAPDPDLGCFYGPDVRCFYGEVRLRPEQARRLKQSASVLVIGSLGRLPISKGASSGEATIENPTAYFRQVRYINLQVSEIWIYSPGTGTVFLKIRPQVEEAAPKLPD